MKTLKIPPTIIAILVGSVSLSSLLGQIDKKGLFGNEERTLKPLSQGGRMKVVSGDGKTSTLLETAQAIWANHDRMKVQLKAIPKAAILGAPISKEEFFQDADVFVAVRRTKVVLRNPQLLRQNNPELASQLGLNSAKPNGAVRIKMKIAQLNEGERKGFNEFLRTKVPRLPADDPLRIAAAMGPDALLQAISRGEGEIEVIDTLAVPRVAGPMLLRGLSLNRNFALKAKPMKLFLGAKPTQPATNNRRSGHTPREPRDPSGVIVFKTNMLTGFTRGNEWRWQRKWRYPSGFFRVDLGGRYAMGLRVPIQVDGRFSSTRRVDGAPRDGGFPGRLELTPSTLDADAAFYRSVGLAENKIHGGKEFVLNVGILFGYKFRVFWTDVAKRSSRWKEINLDKNFAPPSNGSSGRFNLAIPVDLTQTRFGGTGLNGWAQAGFRVTTKGQVTLDAQPVMNGIPVGKRLKLDFPNGKKHVTNLRFPAMPSNQRSCNFGFRVNNPTYSLTGSITPQIRFGVTAGYRSFSKTFRSDWIPLNPFTVDLPNIQLGAHAGTRHEYTYNGGTRTFIPKKSGKTIHEPKGLDIPNHGKIVYLVSVQNGRKIRRMVGSGRWLAAVSKTGGIPEKFELFKLANGTVLLKSSQNGKFVTPERDPSGLLSASVKNAKDAERFKLIPQRDGSVSLYSPSRRRYVRAGIGPSSLLGAASKSVSGWEKFRLQYVKAKKPRTVIPLTR